MLSSKAKGNYVLFTVCGNGCPCRFRGDCTHLNLMRNRIEKKNTFSHLNLNAEPKPLDDDQVDTPSGRMPTVKYINVNGRREHEAIIKDAEWCKELGLDQAYETIVYLNRWGDWLPEN